MQKAPGERINPASLRCFHSAGRISVIGPQDSGQLNFYWEQQEKDFDMTLSGPLGLSAAKIIGNPHEVTLIQGKKTVKSHSAEALLTKYLNIRFPVSALQTLLKTAVKQSEFTAEGWDVAVLKRFDNHLPKILSLQDEDYSVKAVFTEFEVCE